MPLLHLTYCEDIMGMNEQETNTLQVGSGPHFAVGTNRIITQSFYPGRESNPTPLAWQASVSATEPSLSWGWLSGG